MDSIFERRWLVPLLPVSAAALFMVTSVEYFVGFPCFSTGIRYGVWLDECPATDLRLSADVEASLLRGQKGRITVRPELSFLEGEGRAASTQHHDLGRGASVSFTLLDEDDEPVDGLTVEEVEWDDDGIHHEVILDDVRDGHYTLVAEVSTAFETVEPEVDLPMFTPAVAHLMTDRPLYKPGQEVLLRSVLLDRRDLKPLEGRPGRWIIRDPDGVEMLVERDRAGTYGVADSSFPIDTRARQGTWTAEWRSGDDMDSVHFDVRPFQLPRFSVQAEPGQRWYSRGDTVVVEGEARYTSGAPVRDAPVTLEIRRTEGRWPAPLDWEEPFEATTDEDGRFEVEIGEVPSDLIERASFQATVTVTEEAGETTTGGARVVLSEDDLMVEAVTELGDGLVDGFNNRAYVRVSTPDGVPVPKATVALKPAWDPGAEERVAEADVDGVAAFQLDPGKPVTVMIDPPPVRTRPLTPDEPRISSAREGLQRRGLNLEERRAMDAVLPAFGSCGDFAPNGRTVSVGLGVSASGAVTTVLAGDSPAESCVARALRRLRLPAGEQRSFSLGVYVPDSLRPSLRLDVDDVYGGSGLLENALGNAAIRARRCMPRGSGNHGATLATGHWVVTEDSRIPRISMETRTGTGLSPTQTRCVARQLSGVRLADEASSDAMGVFEVDLNVPRPPGTRTPQATARTGYELAVRAETDGAEIGSTRLILDPGHIPQIRLRATPTLALPGDTVEVKILRGPSYSGSLPEELRLMEGTNEVDEAELDEDTRTATFQIPEDVDGFLHVDFAGARTVVLVRPRNPLKVALATGEEVYRPGEQATLTVSTHAGEQPTAAGVGLVGVDQTLSQLAPLLGPDDYGRVTVRAEADNPAFGAFDPRALMLGQVRGDNAAKAAVLRISQLPQDAAGDERVSGFASAEPDPRTELTTAFYRALEATIVHVRAWEEKAPEGETMSPEIMVGFWNDGLDDLVANGEPAEDGYGRPLTLDLLPHDLLEQVDPRQVVADGTRLPEDVVSWTDYVDREVGS